MVTGLALMRWMTKEAYAQYTLAFTFQSTLNLLVNMGFVGGIVALVGNRGKDPNVIGTYLRSSRTYRGRLFWVLSIASAFIFPFIVRNQPWPMETKASLWLAVISSVFLSGWQMYRAPLLIHQRLATSYRVDIVAAVQRLVLSIAAYGAHVLTGPIASWITSLSNLYIGYSLKKHSQELINEPGEMDMEASREMVKYIAPQWPNIIYQAVQSLVTVGLVTAYGGTSAIAEVGALGRLGQIFTVFSASIPTLLVPAVAKLHQKHVLKRLVEMDVLIGVILALITLTAFLFPGFYVFIIGPKYKQLAYLMPITIAGSCISLYGTFHTNFLRARKWATWTTSMVMIGVPLVTQVGWLATHPLTTTREAAIFTFVTYASATACSFGNVWFSALQHRRKAAQEQAA